MQTYAMITNIHTLYIIVPTCTNCPLCPFGNCKNHHTYHTNHIISYHTPHIHIIHCLQQSRTWRTGHMASWLSIRSIRHYFSFFSFFQITHAMKSTSQGWTKWLQHLQPILLKSFGPTCPNQQFQQPILYICREFWWLLLWKRIEKIEKICQTNSPFCKDLFGWMCDFSQMGLQWAYKMWNMWSQQNVVYKMGSL